ncbi:Oidioi.mRNA.OKI2018_I69.XSR.g14607.t1.cds [Oikopleura dioica]|uniref:Oidioi.mRNA.OKI2018_I69.XSR.g14607.t1.cds n=1 Tax=Oikopleura dioica TaxID=34765 RepID=A0ABN7SAB3_OIKDI|nr:Oidioi.mRNA.OKI2018_I69.XSR.g14607.t1.cds [Oikopleura dioica]
MGSQPEMKNNHEDVPNEAGKDPSQPAPPSSQDEAQVEVQQLSQKLEELSSQEKAEDDVESTRTADENSAREVGRNDNVASLVDMGDGTAVCLDCFSTGTLPCDYDLPPQLRPLIEMAAEDRKKDFELYQEEVEKRLEGGEINEELPVDLRELVETAVEDIRRDAARKQVSAKKDAQK